MRLGLSIREHLTIGFGLVIGLILVLLVVGFHLIGKMGEAERQLAHVIAERANEAVNIERAFLNQSIALHSYLATREPQYLVDYQRERQVRQSATERLRNLPPAPGIEIFNRIQAAIANFETLANQSLALLEGGAEQARRDALENRLRAVRGALMDSTRALTDLQDRRRHEAAAQIEGFSGGLIRLLVVLSAGILLICIATASFTIQAVRGPIQRLAEAIGALERGDYAPALDLARRYPRGAGRTRNEMDLLAGTFGRVAETIRRREARLAADREMAAGLASTLDPQVLAEGVLGKILAYTGLEGGAVYLSDADGLTPRLIARQGMEGLPDFLGGEFDPATRALRDGQGAVTYRLPEEHPCRVRRGADLQQPRTLAAEPLIFQERAVGVILAGGAGELGGDGADFMRHAADHLSISLQNALTHQEVRRLAEALKQALGEVRDQAEVLAEADQRKDEFLAMLAHELRNPLAAIANANTVLELGARNEEQARRQRAIVTRQVRHLARMVDDLLDVSRITRGKVALRREPVKLEEAINHAIEACRATLESQHQELTVSLPEEPVILQADPTRLEQMIGNLLHNAVKYTGEGGRIWLEGEIEGQWVSLHVRDTGIGIAPEVLPHVFELFAQAESGPDRAKGGLGIGLTMVKSLAELHGGRVEAHSEGIGQGSEFVVHLPRAA